MTFRLGFTLSMLRSWEPNEEAQVPAKAAVRSKNVRFSEVVACAEAFGFRLDRVSGSHHIFVHPDVAELINLQDVKGKAKPYKIKQLLQTIEAYNLRMEDEE